MGWRGLSNVSKYQMMLNCQKDVNLKKSNTWTVKAIHDVHTYIDINFDILYEGQQNWSKILSLDIWGFLMTIICDVKVYINMCEPHCQFFFVFL